MIYPKGIKSDLLWRVMRGSEDLTISVWNKLSVLTILVWHWSLRRSGLGRFPSVKIRAKSLVPSCKLAVSLVDQNTCVRTQEANKMKMELLCKWKAICSGKFPEILHILFAFHWIKPEILAKWKAPLKCWEFEHQAVGSHSQDIVPWRPRDVLIYVKLM